MSATHAIPSSDLSHLIGCQSIERLIANETLDPIELIDAFTASSTRAAREESIH